MTAIEFLIEKGVLTKGFTEFIVSFSDKKEKIDFVKLLDEYANQSKWIDVELPKKLNTHSSHLTEDVLAFDFNTKTIVIAWYSYQTEMWHCEEDIILNITKWQPLPTV